jgi:hypothetical protein
MAAAAHAAFGDLPKQPLDEIEPTGAGRSVVNVVAGMPRQPSPGSFDLVGTAVVHQQLDIQIRGDNLLDFPQKAQKLLVSMRPVTAAQCKTRGHIERCEQRCYAVPLVLMCFPDRDTRSQRQNRLGTVQRLNMALLVNAENKARQMRTIAACDSPAFCAMSRVLVGDGARSGSGLVQQSLQAPHTKALAPLSTVGLVTPSFCATSQRGGGADNAA